MKYFALITLIFILIISCIGCDKEVSVSLRNGALEVASRFAASKMDSSTVITDNNGVVSVGDELVRYVIDPRNVFYTEIDDNPGKDILVTIDSLHDPYLMPAWHIMLKKQGKQLETVTVLRSDMRVLEINKGIISAEIPTHSPNSPLYYCSECRDTVQYRILNGQIISPE